MKVKLSLLFVIIFVSGSCTHWYYGFFPAEFSGTWSKVYSGTYATESFIFIGGSCTFKSSYTNTNVDYNLKEFDSDSKIFTLESVNDKDLWSLKYMFNSSNTELTLMWGTDYGVVNTYKKN